MNEIRFNEIAGFYTGHAQDAQNGTGVTVILAPEGATGAVDVRGGGPATRETDLLDPKNMVQKINAVVLSGGSAYGLEASSGVMRYCKEKGYGFGLKEFRVPIVCQASLFDLNCGSADAWPDVAMGYQAAQNAQQDEDLSGCVGAGTGASVGKFLGFDKAMKSGLGTCAYEIGDLQVGAIVAVNACGDVYDPDTGTRLAGIYDSKTGIPADSESAVLVMAESAAERTNTTIGCIITNADLDQAQLTKLAGMTQDAFARCIRPVHTPNDGDTIFAMSTNLVPADLTLTAVMAQKAMQEAIVRAVKSAKACYGLPSWSSLQKKEQ